MPAPKLPKITEKQFQAQVIKLARLLRWKVYHTHDSRRSVAGFPDLLLIRHEVILVAELKVGKNKVTPEQEGWLEAFRSAGVRAYVWRPEDWMEIESIIGEGRK